MSQNIPIYPEKTVTTVTVFLFKTQNMRRKSLYWAVSKKGKHTIFTLYILYNTILHTVLSVILHLE